jgi:hypothetical protein
MHSLFERNGLTIMEAHLTSHSCGVTRKLIDQVSRVLCSVCAAGISRWVLFFVIVGSKRLNANLSING